MCSITCTATVAAYPSGQSTQDRQIEFLCPTQSKPLKGTLKEWSKKAQAWYEHKDLKARRRQMREMTRALKRSCYYCHTRDFKRYTEKHLISSQMMAISGDYQIGCKECHIGQRGLSSIGTKSLLMWRYSVREGVTCTSCHPTQSKFTQLTTEGENARKSLGKAIASIGKEFGIESETLLQFINQIKGKKVSHGFQ